MKTTANTQSFQTIYIDSDAEDTQERVVLIEEMSESLPEATGILNSLFKEKFYGLVAAGSTISLANFRAKLYDYDKVNSLGSMDISQALKKIVDVCYSCNCEMVYYKGPSLYKDIPEDLKNVTIAFDIKEILKTGQQVTKKVWDKLLEDKSKVKELEKMNLDEYKKMMTYLEKNEKSFVELQKSLKEHDKINPNNILNEMLHEIEVDEELGEYLGKNYNNLKFYIVKSDMLDVGAVMDEISSIYYSDLPKLDVTKTVTPKKDATKEEREKIERNNKKITDQDKLVADRMRAAENNIVAIGLDDKNKRFLVAVKKAIPPDFLEKSPEWPKKPVSVKLDDIKGAIWDIEAFSAPEEEIREEKSENKQGFQQPKAPVKQS